MEIEKLAYQKLPVFSEKQLSEHHDVLYVGYVKKVNEIRENLKTVETSTANASWSEIRELKLELSFALNGVRLHEWYFKNLGGSGKVSEKIQNKIKKDFGSFEKWQDEFIALGISARGWVVMAENDEGKLENYLCDWHSQGGIWNTKPVLVMDVYEHAYFIDYGTNRKSYIEAFIKNINWKIVERRL